MGWQVKSLGEVITLQRGFDLPKQDRQPGSVPIVSSSGVSGTHDEARVSAPGVVTGRYGSIGQVHFIETDFWPLNTTLFVKDFKGNDPRFVAYLLRTIDFASCSDKSSVPGVNRNDLHRLLVGVPDLPEQRFIAQTLGALDDKIDLNRRMNRTLESIAHALFKSWFVDFDPVHKKMAGGDPGLPPSLAAQLPDSVEASCVGLAPRGWQVSEIGNEVRVMGGSTPSTTNPSYWGGDIAFATPKDLSDLSSPVVLHTARRITNSGAATISSGILPPGALLMSSRAPIGYLAIAEVPVCVNQGFIAMICEGSLPNQFVLQWAHHNMDLIVGNANGTTFLEISKRNFRPLKVVVPPREFCQRFQQIAAALHRRVVGNLRESAWLERLRDTLLPNLISGELSPSAAMTESYGSGIGITQETGS